MLAAVVVAAADSECVVVLVPSLEPIGEEIDTVRTWFRAGDEGSDELLSES